MLKEEPVGWSHNFIKRKCPKCGVDNKIMLVQTQKRFKLGPLKLINKGPRGFGRECLICHDVSTATPGDLKTAQKLEYYFRREISTQSVGLQDKRANRKYPILDNKTRELIRKDNRKEGLISGAAGTVIAIILAIWFSWWKWVLLLVWIGALYAIYEDPEMKHRATIEKHGKVFDGKPTVSRSLRKVL